MDYKLISRLRWVSIAFVWVGLIWKAWSLFGFGVLIWAGTYIYSFSLIERSFYNMVETIKKEKKDGGEDQE